MKKLLVILLGFCFALPAFAADVRAVNNEAWLDHLAQMQVIRQQILSLITRENPTPDDKAVLEALNVEFDAKKAEWDTYLLAVSQGQEPVKADAASVESAKKHDMCCDKTKMKGCCGSAMCKEAGKCIREAKKAHKSCKGCAKYAKCNKTEKKAFDKACSKGKDCCKVTGKECTDKNCGKAAKMAGKACSKGNECCKITDKECTDKNCGSKKECRPAKKRWGRHVCGEACKNGCDKAKMKNCCGSAMCKEIGKCIRDAKKSAKSCEKTAVKACAKGKDCCQVTGKECTDPNCGSNKKGGCK
ncbi:MAG TPA: hypothetical protein DCG57_10565 [Candidatus Riflebacteria bacterium]|jgi:hypothetical protein|nr:hypothetical protein [Candidatus Riflebacteria bacterium]